MTDTKLSIITPVWNRADMTGGYLYQHHKYYSRRDDIEFVIVNNGSTDATASLLDYWQKNDNRITILSNPENVGFGPANNQGAAKAQGDYLLFLNNDITLKGDYITRLLRVLEEHPGDIVGPHLLDYDTGWNVFSGKPISFIMGWCLALHRDTFNHLGGWDERFAPADYEDLDLCYHAQREGIRLVECQLPLHHIGRQTADTQLDRDKVTHRNRLLFAQKWGFSLNGVHK